MGLGVEHRADKARPFQLFVREAVFPHKVDPGFLKPADVVGVVDAVHAVGFIIVDRAEIKGLGHRVACFLYKI